MDERLAGHKAGSRQVSHILPSCFVVVYLLLETCYI